MRRDCFIENASKNTAENMALSKASIDARSPEGYRCAYATSNYHVMRAGIYARKAGLPSYLLSSLI